MTVSERIDRLIEAGWCVVDSGFDPVAFRNWKRQALDCLTVLLEPDHAYIRHFKGPIEEVPFRADPTLVGSMPAGIVRGHGWESPP